LRSPAAGGERGRLAPEGLAGEPPAVGQLLGGESELVGLSDGKRAAHDAYATCAAQARASAREFKAGSYTAGGWPAAG